MVSSTLSPRGRGARLITGGSGRETTNARGLLLELDLQRLTLLECLLDPPPAGSAIQPAYVASVRKMCDATRACAPAARCAVARDRRSAGRQAGARGDPARPA